MLDKHKSETISSRLHRASILANLTIKELNFLGELLSKISNYSKKNTIFEELAISLDVIPSYEKRLSSSVEWISNFSKEKNDGITHRLKNITNKLSITSVSPAPEVLLSEINQKMGVTRQFIDNVVRKIQNGLLAILFENFHSISVLQTKTIIKAAITRQLDLGVPIEQLINANAKGKLDSQHNNFKSLKLKLDRLSKNLKNSQTRVTKAFQFGNDNVSDSIVDYYQAIAEILPGYLEIIEIAGTYDPDTLVNLLYDTVPWLSKTSNDRDQKLNKIKKEQPNWAYEMQEKSLADEEDIKKVVANAHQGLDKYDEFLLHETVSSTVKKGRSATENLSQEKGIKLFGEEKFNTYKIHINNFEKILDRFNCTNQTKKDEAATQALALFLTIPAELRPHLTQFVPDYSSVIQRMIVEYPHVAHARKYGTKEEHKEINPLAAELHSSLKEYLNNPNINKKQLHKAHALINAVWNMYFSLKNEKIEKIEAFENIEMAVNNYFNQPTRIIPDSLTWDFISHLANILPSNNAATKWLEKKNDIAWPFPKEISRHIFSFSNPKSLTNLSQSCKALNTIANEDTIWKPLCQQYGYLPTDNAKTAFISNKKVDLINKYLKTCKQYFETIITRNNESQWHVHLHDFQFKFDGDKFISERIVRNSEKAFASLKEEASFTQNPLQFKLLNEHAGSYRVEIISIDSDKLQKLIKQQEEEIQKHEAKLRP